MTDNLIRILLKEEIDRKDKEDKKEEKARDKVVTTRHTIKINGEAVPFTAKAGYMPMKDDNDEVEYRIFFISYTRDDVKEKAKRPVTFAFNGGPGASSIWLHFGALGPKKVKLSHEGFKLPPPFVLEDNPHTWLSFTDLVFIDPVGTGFSRAAKTEETEKYYDLKNDLESVGGFIRLYLTQNERWLSPKFLAGESYGTLRAAGLAGTLQDSLGIDLNGLVLISLAFDYQNFVMEKGNDLSYILVLPSYTATAWYHKKLDPDLLEEDLDKILREVENWAIDHYLPILARGGSLTDEEFDKAAGQLARYTGLSKQFVKNCRLRVNTIRFAKELLRDKDRIVGVLDTRYKGIDADSAGEYVEYDPSFLWAPFVASVLEYTRNDLKYENDLPFIYISYEGNMNWNYGDKKEDNLGFPSTAESLRREMCRNRYLKVFAANGYYDLATPHLATQYALNHLGLPHDRRKNITLKFYRTGHMIYAHQPSLVELKEDVEKFYRNGQDG